MSDNALLNEKQRADYNFDRCMELEAENKRLRAVLEAIATHPSAVSEYDDYGTEVCHACGEVGNKEKPLIHDVSDEYRCPYGLAQQVIQQATQEEK